MKRFPAFEDLNQEERDVFDLVWTAWLDQVPPPDGSVFSSNRLLANETDQYFELTWQALYDRCEELIYADSLIVLKIEDLAYLLPTFLLCSLQEGETDLPSYIFDLLDPSDGHFDALLKPLLTPTQCRAIYGYLELRLRRFEEGVEFHRQLRPFASYDWEEIDMYRKKYALGLDYWRGASGG